MSDPAGRTSTLHIARLLWSLYQVTDLPQRVLATLRPFICPVTPVLNSVPGDVDVLDIGCGNGLALSLMAHYRNLRSGTGVEINRSALEAATAVSQKAGLPLRFEYSSTHANWPAELFDVVTMIDVLHHVPKELRKDFVVSALDRVRPGGRFVFKDMTSKPWWRVTWNALHDLVLAHQVVHIQPLNDVILWAESRGFSVVERQSYTACIVYGHDLVLFERNL